MNAPHPSGLTCIHALLGLCAECKDDYDEDPSAYFEFGDHPHGIANWKRLQDEIAADRPAEHDNTPPAVYDGEIPF